MAVWSVLKITTMHVIPKKKNVICGSVAQWLTLSPHRKKVWGLNLLTDLYVWSLDYLSMPVGGYSGCSGVLPESKDMLIGSNGSSKSSTGVNGCLALWSAQGVTLLLALCQISSSLFVKKQIVIHMGIITEIKENLNFQPETEFQTPGGKEDDGLRRALEERGCFIATHQQTWWPIQNRNNQSFSSDKGTAWIFLRKADDHYTNVSQCENITLGNVFIQMQSNYICIMKHRIPKCNCL